MKVLALLFACVGATLAIADYERNCHDEPESGMCLAYMPMYYYDPETGTCKKFIYGGCQGNGNRYRTEQECLDNCARLGSGSNEICTLAPEVGPCYAIIPRYFYNHEAGKCEKFIYGGCGGNSNRFETEAECYKACPKRDRSDVSVCELEPETGMCKARKPRYFFNKNSGKCEFFIYGGCGGNGNNFRDEESCYKACGQRADVSVCKLDAETGPCRAYFPSYYYNAETGTCEKFIYGGCQGNGNRFADEEECYATCLGVRKADDYCNLEPAVGPCKGYFTRYFFNKNSGVCEEFIYGGCSGNKNNFLTLEDCTAACGTA